MKQLLIAAYTSISREFLLGWKQRSQSVSRASDEARVRSQGVFGLNSGVLAAQFLPVPGKQ